MANKDHIGQIPFGHVVDDGCGPLSMRHVLVSSDAVPGDRGCVGDVSDLFEPFDHPVPRAPVVKGTVDKDESGQLIAPRVL